MKHTTDIKLFYVVILFSLLSGCAAPPLVNGDVLPMGTGSALYIFEQACAKAAGTEVWRGTIPGGTGYLFLKGYTGWFGSVLLGANGKCGDLCLQKLLNLTGNAMTPQTMQQLVEQARALGWEKVDPVALPAWMRMVSGIVRASYSAAQLGTGWIVIIPAGAFVTPEGIAIEVDN